MMKLKNKNRQKMKNALMIIIFLKGFVCLSTNSRMNGDVVASLLHQSVTNREAGMVRGWRSAYIYNNHSFKRSMFFYFGIIFDALASFKTMLLMNKNQSVGTREARKVRGD